MVQLMSEPVEQMSEAELWAALATLEIPEAGDTDILEDIDLDFTEQVGYAESTQPYLY